jgi:radical SAM superfamily enzyme YgiQ (UPF0313 family)
MSCSRRKVLLVQLPIPPVGLEPIRGNVPLAGAYLKLFARQRGLEPCYEIDILPTDAANTYGDQALVAAIAERDPWLVGFTCYVWNIERTLWIARELKKRRPAPRIVLGGPEITADNAWVLETADYDFAVIGEGEQTFADLLSALTENHNPSWSIPGLYVAPLGNVSRFELAAQPAFRTPLPDLNALGSPYVAGILDAADEQMLLLETTRGCVFKCKFCYYPKSYDGQYFLSRENILANLHHAQERNVREVFLLDPTLNQRRDFPDFLRVLAEGNPGRRFSYFGELRGEGITEETALLLRDANFTEVEVGLQSVAAEAQKKMDRKNNLKAFERGVRAMMGEGIAVKVDLIIGLPGDTVNSVRQGLRYLHDSGLYSDMQVFHLSILPGTAFRHEASELGLKHQSRPPYYLLETPTLGREDLFMLMHEAQELFGIEFDSPAAPVLDFEGHDFMKRVWFVDLDEPSIPMPPDRYAQAFTIWFRALRFDRQVDRAKAWIRSVLDANPFTTLQIVLEPSGELSPADLQRRLRPQVLESIFAATQVHATYLDHYYAMQPGQARGAKRLVVVVPQGVLSYCEPKWVEMMDERVTLIRHENAFKQTIQAI